MESGTDKRVVGAAGDDGIGAVIVQVAEDAKAYGAAQVALYKAMATVRLRVAKAGLILGAVAAVLGLAALGAMLIGLILALATSTGPLAATAIVVGVTLVIAGVLGKMAGSRIARALGSFE